jgi:hypothetical protein
MVPEDERRFLLQRMRKYSNDGTLDEDKSNPCRLLSFLQEAHMEFSLSQKKKDSVFSLITEHR